MLNRNHIAAIALSALSASAFADDGDVRHAQRLADEARGFGVAQVAGQAAGQTEARREQRRDADGLTANERRWREIQRSQSLN